MHRSLAVVVLAGLALMTREARAGDRTFPAGSLIIPMDLSYQSEGVLQAYGLIFQLLRNGVPVVWIIDPMKTYHPAACNTPGDTCAWDCSASPGVKCPYPTASPDLTATTKVVWDDRRVAARGSAVGTHAYRAGPFAITATDRDRALAIIEAWNDQALWPANPWAMRTTFEVVTVHEATAPFTGNVAKEMLAAPTIAVFSDGNEDIATGYLRAAGIPQSTGAEFPAAKCGAASCGPGTPNPDMLSPEAVAGDLGTCGAPNQDHKNGALFRADGLPAYCQIMSMHWDVGTRESVKCAGGNCPVTQALCAPTTPFTFNGHEVVAEVRSFLGYPVHFFAECQAVNAYENTTPNPAWPFLDDPGRDGHFLTTTGTPPACPCTDAEFECVIGGCNGANCCLPRDLKERGAGFMIAPQPASSTLKVLRPEVPYNQFDGAFATVGGSEPAYNLSAYLQTSYKNNRQVTLITGPNGPGASDVWMSGYLDGSCDIGPILGPPAPGAPKGAPRAACAGGKISYLGGHQYSTATPLASGSQAMGARLFLNALFEADCVTSEGQPVIALELTPIVVGVASFPGDAQLMASYANLGVGPALDGALAQLVPAGVTLVDAAGGSVAGARATWSVGAISGVPVRAGDPAASGGRTSTVRFAAAGDYEITLALTYQVGSSTLTKTTAFSVHVGLDGDGDGVPDDVDPEPDDPTKCGDSDADGCDDCTSGRYDPANDACDNPATGDGDGAGAGCCSANDGPGSAAVLAACGLMMLLRPRRRGAPRSSM